MSIILELLAELETQLATEAARLNSPLIEYILHILANEQVLNNPPRNGAELVAYWQREGVINSRPDITNSQAYA